MSALRRKPLNSVDKFLYLDSNISSTESDVNIYLVKVSTAFDRLSVILKSDRSDKIKRNFLLAVSVSRLIYGCKKWTLT